jgi:hypothetical protein
LSKENRLIRQAVFILSYFCRKRPLAFSDKGDFSLPRTLRGLFNKLGARREYPQFMSGMFIIFPILGHGIFTN